MPHVSIVRAAPGKKVSRFQLPRHQELTHSWFNALPSIIKPRIFFPNHNITLFIFPRRADGLTLKNRAVVYQYVCVTRVEISTRVKWLERKWRHFKDIRRPFCFYLTRISPLRISCSEICIKLLMPTVSNTQLVSISREKFSKREYAYFFPFPCLFYRSLITVRVLPRENCEYRKYRTVKEDYCLFIKRVYLRI